ncbi:MAG: hypothetical protein KF749_17700 [Bacteroidetes bacterium]|nr:hypothetical protein [Bacteroidota bacterium]MCW5896342.1 hypothetical protein [Bacteroidota bacterium]
MSVDKKNLEDFVLVVLIAVGLIGCSIFFFQDGGKPLSAFFAAFALSCIVYRFLGGIAQETSFRMGFLKLGGSAAFIIASIWFLNTQVFVLQESIVVSMPERTRWYPVRMDNGNPDTVTIMSSTGVRDSFRISPGDYETLRNNEYTLEPERGSRFLIKKGSTVLGFADTVLSNKPTRIHEADIVMLYPYGNPREFSTSKYPFKVVVEGGSFHIRTAATNEPACDDCTDREVVKKKHVFFEMNGNQYVCFVLQANHQIEQKEWYSQYLIGRLDFKN